MSMLPAHALLGWFLFAFVCLANLTNIAAQSRVELVTRGSEVRLLRNGQEYPIRGVGGEADFELLAQLGGNSVRTWGVDNLGTVLDAAQRHGLTVCAGLWLGHERHGFNYQDEAAVLKQLEACLAAVRKYKDHPALLLWGIGNEMEGDGRNPAVWYAIDHIAREVKRLDPHHPTMTVVAEIGNDKVAKLERYCPHIDIVGVNSYGGIASLVQRYTAGGGTKPFVVTEHGPHGPWEVEKTRWGAPREATSTAKGEAYAAGYKEVTAASGGRCLGTYAFLWGQKQETTATWFGMLLPKGTRLAAADAMATVWTGKPPKNRVPEIAAFTLERTDQLQPGEVVLAKLTATDPERDPLDIRWVVRHDSATIGVGGDVQAAEPELAGAVVASGQQAKLTVPAGGGGYRLYAYVFDGQGGAAVANVPFYVNAPERVVPSPKAKLPLAIYADDAEPSPFVPSGYMGNTKAITLSPDCSEQPHTGETCLKVEYGAADNWGGVLWQSPANDWKGERPGGLNFTGATALEFWARGAAGGEVVTFLFGTADGDTPYRDTARGEIKEVRLINEWQKYRIPLEGRDLSRIKTGFGWSLGGQGKDVVFYLDDIRYVGP
jgi:hypothetical protein